MGPSLSLLRLKEKDNDNYEKILSELDEQISNSKVRLCDIKIRQKRSTIFWLVFSTVLYIAYVSGWYFFGWKSKYDETWQLWLLKLFPVFAFPFIIWLVKKFMSMWYRRKEANEKSQLKHLVARKKLKIEELKKKTGYYATQNLIERFDVNNSQKSLSKSVNFPALPNEWNQSNDHFTDDSQVADTGLRLRLSTSTLETKDESSMTPSAYYNAIPPSNTPLKRTWYDRVIDLLAGEEGQYKKFALICSNCHAHNGLVSQQDLDDVQYFCPKCDHFNPSRRIKRDETNGAVNSNNNTNDENNGGSSRKKGANKQSGNMGSPTPRRGRSTTPRPTTSSNEMMNNDVTTDDYDDDGVAVSKRLTSRSTSRRRRAGSRSQSRLEDSEEEGMRRYETSDEEYVSRRRIHE